MKPKSLYNIYSEQVVMISEPPVSDRDVRNANYEEMDDECCCDCYDEVIGMLTQLRNREDHAHHSDIIEGFKEVLKGLVGDTTIEGGMFTQQGAESVSDMDVMMKYYGNI